MKLKLIILLSILFAFTGIAKAQNTSRTDESPVAKFKAAMEAPPADILKAKLDQVKDIEVEQIAKKLNIDYDTAVTVKSLKNPFISQFPDDNKNSKTNTPPPTPIEPNPGHEVSPAVPIPQFIVTGMVWNTKKPSAIVNGRVVGVGDQISNWAITEISKQGVHVSYDTQNLWIKPVESPSMHKRQDTDQPSLR